MENYKKILKNILFDTYYLNNDNFIGIIHFDHLDDNSVFVKYQFLDINNKVIDKRAIIKSTELNAYMFEFLLAKLQ